MIYVNDNCTKWQGGFADLVAACRTGSRFPRAGHGVGCAHARPAAVGYGRAVRAQPVGLARAPVSHPERLSVDATHRRNAPDDPAVADAFEALGVDTVYRELCRQQQCFRARFTAKPWRIGIHDKLKPPYAAWQPEHAQLPQRQAWIAEYERKASAHAACHDLETLGRGRDDADILPVVELHDRLCHAQQKQLPLA